MSGEINPNLDANLALYAARDKGVQAKTEGQAEAKDRGSVGAGADSVVLTDRAQQLLRLEEQLAQFPAVDSQRVDAIRKSLADGSYQIDTQLIADRMLQMQEDQNKPGG